jgi:RHS repeat-associated protein
MLESTPTTDLSACSLSVAFGNHHKFTGKERDAESGLDNFGARYNASTMGRFMSPDGAPHLHFEVHKILKGGEVPVDPYGWWQGKTADPYTPQAVNVNLWK